MFIRLPPNYRLPYKIYVGFSSGVDSMALLHFLTKSSRREVIVAHFNHGTPNASRYENFAETIANKYSLPIIKEKFGEVDPSKSLEHQWAIARHNFFSSLDAPVAIAHHLDDAVETWLSSCLDGHPHLMEWETRNCIRPFLLNTKDVLQQFCIQNNLNWVEDPTNYELVAQRNKVRHQLLPEALKVNPGLKTVVRKMLLNNYFK